MEYLIKFTSILSLFYFFYKLFLQNETFFQSIRSYFLIGILTAITLPLIVITQYIIVEPVPVSAQLLQTSLSQTFAVDEINWNQMFLLIYIIGVAVFSLRFLIQLISLLWMLFTHSKTKEGKYYLIKTQKDLAPFSFFNYIVYNPQKFSSTEMEQILIHEKIHVDQLHSIDIILTRLIIILNWFNPFIWFYNKEVQKNLEFIADDCSQNFANEKKTYQYLLLKTISPDLQLALTNNFFNSLIKKRINMLQKKRSNKTRYFKFVFIIPILIAFVFTFNTQVTAQQKKVKLEEIHKDYEVEIITKDFTKNDLEKLKTRLAAQGITFKYKKLKYNFNNEITSIGLSVKFNDSNANFSTNSNKAIEAIAINIDKENNSISLGSIADDKQMNKVVFSSGDKVIHKKIIVNSSDEGTENKVAWISKNDTNTFDEKGANSFVFVTDDDGEKNEKYELIVKSNDDLHIGNSNENQSNVWISKDGDSTKIKQVRIIEIEKDGDGSNNIFTKKGSSDDEHDIFIQSNSKTSGKHGNIFIMDSDGEKPLFIIDGKQVENGNMKDIDADNIEKIEVLKGDKAIDKYGGKAKDGVVIITTKKEK